MNLTTSQTEYEEKLDQMRRHGAIVKGDFIGAMTRTQMEVGAVERTADEMVIRGPGKMNIIGEVAMQSAPDWLQAQIAIALVEAVTEWRITLTPTLVKSSQNPDEFLWVQKQ